MYAASVKVALPIGNPVAVRLVAWEGVTSKLRVTVEPAAETLRTRHLTSDGTTVVDRNTEADSTPLSAIGIVVEAGWSLQPTRPSSNCKLLPRTKMPRSFEYFDK